MSSLEITVVAGGIMFTTEVTIPRTDFKHSDRRWQVAESVAALLSVAWGINFAVHEVLPPVQSPGKRRWNSANLRSGIVGHHVSIGWFED